ncbi:hypothetical protein [Streptomyces sp. bgisy154]|uniref:hypothetical protein n=1 Tax=Streptomyces sp. bgisy154 TaxID=3413794 RepID=UPI003D71615B
MRIRTAAITAAAILGATLTACSSPEPDATATPSATPPTLTDEQRESAAAAAGYPPMPTGAKRTELLAALKAVNPGIVRYEDKAISAARNQCSAINSGSDKVDWFASQRFTYKDVTTSEAQGKQINDALKRLGFCKV